MFQTGIKVQIVILELWNYIKEISGNFIFLKSQEPSNTCRFLYVSGKEGFIVYFYSLFDLYFTSSEPVYAVPKQYLMMEKMEQMDGYFAKWEWKITKF